MFEDLPRQHLLEITITSCLLLMITLDDVGYIPWNTKGKSQSYLWSGKRIWRRIQKERSKYSVWDNGGEYTSDLFLQLCHDEGIDMYFTVREALQQNRVAEKMNRTLLEKVRCMLSNTELSISFWAEVLAYAWHLINMSSSAIEGKTPFEVWS